HPLAGPAQPVHDPPLHALAEGQHQHDRERAPRDREGREDRTRLLRLEVAPEFLQQDLDHVLRHSTTSRLAARRAGNIPASPAIAPRSAIVAVSTEAEISARPTCSSIGSIPTNATRP